MVERGLILECNTHGTLVLTARRFGPKRAFVRCKLLFSVLYLQLKKALLGPKHLAVRTSVQRVLLARITPPTNTDYYLECMEYGHTMEQYST